MDPFQAPKSPIQKIREAHPEWAHLCNVCAAFKAGLPIKPLGHGPAGSSEILPAR